MTAYKIGLFSDVHDDGEGSSYATIAAIQAWFAANNTDAAFITGDVMDLYAPGDAATIYPQFTPNTYWIPGDHDGGAGAFMSELPLVQSVDTVTCDFRRDFGNWTFLCFNDVRPGGMVVDDITSAWMVQQLATCVGRYVILMCHAPVVQNGVGAVGSVFCSTPEKVLGPIATAKANGVFVRAMIFGHTHGSGYTPPLYDIYNGVYCYGIDACDDGVNAAVLEVDDNGSLSIIGLGAQKAFSNIRDIVGYTPTPPIGLISVNGGSQYSTIIQLFQAIGEAASISSIIVEGAPLWIAAVAQYVVASIVYYPDTRRVDITIGETKYSGVYSTSGGLINISVS